MKHDRYTGSQGSAFRDTSIAQNRGRYNTIIEFDENGKTVWIWHDEKYLEASDYVNYWPGDISRRYEPTHERVLFR